MAAGRSSAPTSSSRGTCPPPSASESRPAYGRSISAARRARWQATDPKQVERSSPCSTARDRGCATPLRDPFARWSVSRVFRTTRRSTSPSSTPTGRRSRARALPEFQIGLLCVDVQHSGTSPCSALVTAGDVGLSRAGAAWRGLAAAASARGARRRACDGTPPEVPPAAGRDEDDSAKGVRRRAPQHPHPVWRVRPADPFLARRRHARVGRRLPPGARRADRLPRPLRQQSPLREHPVRARHRPGREPQRRVQRPAHARGTSILRVDAQVVWVYPRSPKESVRASRVREIDFSAPNVSKQVTDPSEIARIVRWFNTIPIVPPGLGAAMLRCRYRRCR